MKEFKKVQFIHLNSCVFCKLPGFKRAATVVITLSFKREEYLR